MENVVLSSIELVLSIIMLIGIIILAVAYIKAYRKAKDKENLVLHLNGKLQVAENTVTKEQQAKFIKTFLKDMERKVREEKKYYCIAGINRCEEEFMTPEEARKGNVTKLKKKV